MGSSEALEQQVAVLRSGSSPQGERYCHQVGGGDVGLGGHRQRGADLRRALLGLARERGRPGAVEPGHPPLLDHRPRHRARPVASP
jgi:hypothetical protein